MSLLLVVASVVAGSYLLPSSEGLSTDAAIQQIQMIFGVQGQQAYLGVIGEDSHDGDIFIGTNTNQAPVHWELTFFVNPRDSLTIVSDPQQVGTGQGSWSVGSLSSRQSDAGAFWYTLDGTITNTPTGYSELGKGYMQYVEDNDAAFKRVAVGTSPLLNPDQRNIVGIAFHIDGPVGFDNKSATQIRVNAPALDSFDSVFANGSPGYGAASLSSDMLYASVAEDGYTLGEGGETDGAVETSIGFWDWFNAGALLAPSAVGTNDKAAANDQKKVFIAAVAFGVAGAALAAFAVELVEGIRETRHGPKTLKRLSRR